MCEQPGAACYVLIPADVAEVCLSKELLAEAKLGEEVTLVSLKRVFGLGYRLWPPSSVWLPG